jgi:hypothetical protein
VRQEEYRDLRKDLLDRKLKKMQKQAMRYEVNLEELLHMIEDIGEVREENTHHWLQGTG